MAAQCDENQPSSVWYVKKTTLKIAIIPSKHHKSLRNCEQILFSWYVVRTISKGYYPLQHTLWNAFTYEFCSYTNSMSKFKQILKVLKSENVNRARFYKCYIQYFINAEIHFRRLYKHRFKFCFVVDFLSMKVTYTQEMTPCNSPALKVCPDMTISNSCHKL